MSEQNNIITYESIYKHEQEGHDHNSNNNLNYDKNSLINLIIYFLLMFVGLGSILAGSLFKSKTNAYILMERLEKKANYSLAIVSRDEYIGEKDHFPSLKPISYQDYIIVYHDSLNEETVSWLSEPDTLEVIISGNIERFPIEFEVMKGTNIDVYYHFDSKLGQTLFKLDKQNYNPVFANKTIDHSILINIITYVILLIPIVLINYKKIFKDFDMLIKDEKNPIVGSLLSGFIMLLALSMAIGVVTLGVSSILKIPTSKSINQLELETMFSSKLFILLLLMTVVAAPIVEEVVFRFSIFSLIKNDKAAMHVSSLTFGLIHLSTELQLIIMKGITFDRIISLILVSASYIAMGYLFAYYYKKTNKNLTFVILLHAMNNLFASLSIFF